MKSILLVLLLLIISGIHNPTFSEKTTKVIVYRNESMPWCGTVDGKDAGITVDILNEITKHGGPRFVFKEFPWLRATQHVRTHKGTTIIPLTRTPGREKHFNWIIKLVPNKVLITTTTDIIDSLEIPPPLTLSSFKQRPVGIIRGSSIIPILKANGFKKIQEVGLAEQNAKKLAAGRIVGIVESQFVANYWWYTIGKSPKDLVLGPQVGPVYDIYLASSHDFPEEIVLQIREVMEILKQNGTIEKIYSKWMNLN